MHQRCTTVALPRFNHEEISVNPKSVLHTNWPVLFTSVYVIKVQERLDGLSQIVGDWGGMITKSYLNPRSDPGPEKDISGKTGKTWIRFVN